MKNSGRLFGSDSIFINPSVGEADIGKVISEVEKFIKADEGEYRLIIGSDSHLRFSKGKHALELVTAIVIHRIGRGGRYFWTKRVIGRYFSLKEKIYQETLASLELADRLLPLLKKSLNGQFRDLEIHIDAGGRGPTKELIKELVGMVNGNGFTAKTKPDSYGAFVVADRYT
jgi:hypothetical protein